jgi:hypothetical protein
MKCVLVIKHLIIFKKMNKPLIAKFITSNPDPWLMLIK